MAETTTAQRAILRRYYRFLRRIHDRQESRRLVIALAGSLQAEP